MPSLTHRACGHPGCALTTPHSHRARDERESASRRGYGTHHQRWRKPVLHRCPVCNICKRAASYHADHIQRLDDGGGWSLSNSQGLCASCHSWKTHVIDSQAKGLSISAILDLQAELYQKLETGN